MSFSTSMFIHPPALSPNFKSKIVCSCPWSTNNNNHHQSSFNNPPSSLSSNFNAGPKTLPPGPSPLHLITHLPPYLIQSLPYHYPLRDLARTYGPLMHINLAELSLIVVSSPSTAREVLKTHDVACSDRPKTMTGEVMCYNYSDILFSPYGHYWKEMRRVCSSELLGGKSTRSFEYIREEEASELIRSIESTRGAEFNLTEKIVLSVGSVTSRAMIGKMATEESALRKVDKDAIVKAVKKATGYAGHLYLTDLFPSMEVLKMVSLERVEMLKMRWETEKVLDYVIEEHRKKLDSTGMGSGELGSDDLVDVLLRFKESGDVDISITNDNIKAVISDMAVGGSETVVTTLDWAMAELMKNPRVMAKAQAEIRQVFKGKKINTIPESEIGRFKYLKMVVKETLRLHPPNCIIPRSCREEFEVDGYHIPLNAIILVNIWAIGRDPKYWRNAERFQPERFDGNSIDYSGTHFEYLPFGSGKRMCPGITFGIATIELILAHLLYHFDWKLPTGVRPRDIDMSESDGAAVSRKSSLHLVAKPYNP